MLFQAIFFEARIWEFSLVIFPNFKLDLVGDELLGSLLPPFVVLVEVSPIVPYKLTHMNVVH